MPLITLEIFSCSNVHSINKIITLKNLLINGSTITQSDIDGLDLHSLKISNSLQIIDWMINLKSLTLHSRAHIPTAALNLEKLITSHNTIKLDISHMTNIKHIHINKNISQEEISRLHAPHLKRLKIFYNDIFMI